MKILGGVLLMGLCLGGLLGANSIWLIMVLAFGFFAGLEIYTSGKIENALEKLADKVDNDKEDTTLLE